LWWWCWSFLEETSVGARRGWCGEWHGTKNDVALNFNLRLNPLWFLREIKFLKTKRSNGLSDDSKILYLPKQFLKVSLLCDWEQKTRVGPKTGPPQNCDLYRQRKRYGYFSHLEPVSINHRKHEDFFSIASIHWLTTHRLSQPPQLQSRSSKNSPSDSEMLF
jgi:hypothetical protein